MTGSGPNVAQHLSVNKVLLVCGHTPCCAGTPSPPTAKGSGPTEAAWPAHLQTSTESLLNLD